MCSFSMSTLHPSILEIHLEERQKEFSKETRKDKRKFSLVTLDAGWVAMAISKLKKTNNTTAWIDQKCLCTF